MPYIMLMHCWRADHVQRIINQLYLIVYVLKEGNLLCNLVQTNTQEVLICATTDGR